MKRRVITVVVSVVLLIVFTSTVTYALFQMIRDITGEASSGKIVLKSEAYYATVDNEAIQINSEHGFNKGYVSLYASQKRNSDTENYYHINQLSYQIVINNAIDTRLRIKVQDSWISRKLYTNNVVKENTIIKDYNNNPFAFAEANWTFYPETGYLYYNYIIKPGDDKTLELFTNPDYEYAISSSFGYMETVFVNMSFKVDMIQANRAIAKWGSNIPSATYEQ